MSEWREVEINEIIDMANTGLDAIKRAPIVENDTGIKCMRIQDVSQNKSFENWGFTDVEEKNYKKFQLKKNDIIIARTGATVGVNRFIYSDLKSVFNNGLIRIRVDHITCLSKFLYYHFRTDNFYSFIESISGGTSSQPNMQINVLLSYAILLSPLPEQKAIAEVLSSLDDKIDLLHRQNKTLEQMAETLFRQWFVEEAGEDWEEVLLSDLIEIKGGFSYKGKYIGEGSSLLLGMGCVSFNNRFLHTGARLYSGECPISHLVEPGDLVIATRQQSDNMPILGFPAIIPKSYEGKKVIVGTNLYRLINNSEFDNYFFYKLFRIAEYRSHILSCAKGSTVRMITKDAIESYVIRKPPTEIYNNYQSKSVKINNRINNIVEQIRTLESLRDTLLPKLMSGEVRIASHG